MRIAPIELWAVVVMQPRSHWILPHTISRTRKAAANEYIATWLPEYQETRRRERNKKWRTVRVSVTALGAPSGVSRAGSKA
jgi:hypothetical protein